VSRVLVAMSGGVDSSVAAALLLREGHDVTGVTLKLWGGPQDQGCCSVSDVDDARRVAQQLGIDHFVFNYGDLFEERVVDPYVEAHASGLTPNPCVECNRHVKFDALLDRARRLGFDHLATGHHVRLADTSEGLRLRRGVDDAKDQSYVLYMLDGSQLPFLSFPVGHLTKAEVRETAAALGLRTAAKAESQDVCFITEQEGRARFLGERIQLHSGELVDVDGRPVGRVEAVELVTIGQRKGLDLGGNRGRSYAVAVDAPRRRVVVGSAGDLLTDALSLDTHCWVDAPRQGPVLVQTSAHGPTRAGSLDATGQLRWDEPQRRVAPGQMAVFYDGDLVLGGATVARDPVPEDVTPLPQ
jgi:tRNA-specific 2-thiouridylase